MKCSRCETDDTDELVPVWEDPERHEQGKDHKFIGCLNCHWMTRVNDD